MANIDNIRSDRKKYKEHFRKCHSENPFMLAFVPMREFGFYIMAFAAAYLCIYFAVFDGASMENDTRIACVIVGVCITAVTVAAIFLRKIIRGYKFRKYSGLPTPLYKGNRWICPCCKADNNTLSPCKICGIYPQLYKSDDIPPQRIQYKKRSKKVEQQYKDYTPLFKED